MRECVAELPVFPQFDNARKRIAAELDMLAAATSLSLLSTAGTANATVLTVLKVDVGVDDLWEEPLQPQLAVHF